MKEKVAEFFSLLENDTFDHERCHQIIDELDGPTSVVVAEPNFLTTPLREVIERGHYDFAQGARSIADAKAGLFVLEIRNALRSLSTQLETKNKSASGGP